MKHLPNYPPIVSACLFLASLLMFSLYLPPLSELEGAASLGQIYAFVPAAVSYVIGFPLVLVMTILHLLAKTDQGIYRILRWTYLIMTCLIISFICLKPLRREIGLPILGLLANQGISVPSFLMFTASFLTGGLFLLAILLYRSRKG